MIGQPSQGAGGATLATISDMSALMRTVNDDTTGDAVLTTLGVSAAVAELNYVDGVTSAIQTQLNGKAALGASEWTQVRRTTGGTAVNNSTTLVSDDVLKFTPAAGTVEVEGLLRVTCAVGGTGGMKLAMSGVTSALYGFCNGYHTSVVNTILNASTNIQAASSINFVIIYFRFSFDCAAQEYALQMAQNAVAVGDTTINAGSYIRWHQVV